MMLLLVAGGFFFMAGVLCAAFAAHDVYFGTGRWRLSSETVGMVAQLVLSAAFFAAWSLCQIITLKRVLGLS